MSSVSEKIAELEKSPSVVTKLLEKYSIHAILLVIVIIIIFFYFSSSSEPSGSSYNLQMLEEAVSSINNS